MIVPSDIGLPEKFVTFRSYPGFSQWNTSAEMAASELRYLGLCAPPGAGKTTCNMTVSRILDAPRTLYLTVNKPLQSQLMNDFADSPLRLFNLVGHSAYPCMSRYYDDSGDLSDVECSEPREECPYYVDVTLSLSRTHVCTNYANWISIAKVGDPDRFGKFDLLILDEAHNLESLLCSLLSIKLSRRTVYQLLTRDLPPSNSQLETWISWALEMLPVSESALSRSRSSDKVDNRGRESRETKRIKRLQEHLETISEIRDEWVIEQTNTGVQLTPAFASNYAEKYLFRGIPKILLSSATLTSKDFEYLGLSRSDYDLHDIESGFDVQRRPFYYWPCIEMDYRTMDVEGCVRQVMNRLDRIIDANSADKGIIHTISYRYAEMIAETSRHRIITHKSHNAQNVIRRFMSDPVPGVLASPIISEGFDFDGDKARWNLIWKVPTVDSRNPLIAMRKKRDKTYTLYLAGKSIMQMVGRVCRSTSDYGWSGIMDKHWGRWMQRAIPWPRYFRASWKTINDVPQPLKF